MKKLTRFSSLHRSIYLVRELQMTRVTVLIIWFCVSAALSAQADNPGFIRAEVHSILQDNCYHCHADGASEGSMSFDEWLALDDPDAVKQRWYKVQQQLQLGLMPPPSEPSLDEGDRERLLSWIKFDALGIDPEALDPGRVTIRRLNQTEYRNNVRDLMGVDYDTTANFPADDTGHGFDNIGDVLSMSPLLLEKYVDAAKSIVDSVVPVVSGIPRETSIKGSEFQLDRSSTLPQPNGDSPGANPVRGDSLELSYYLPNRARAATQVELAGNYQIRLNLVARETYVDGQFDDNQCEFSFVMNGETLIHRKFVRQGGVDFTFNFDRSLESGEHQFEVAIEPLTNQPQIRQLRIAVRSVDLIGPLSEEHYVKPEGHDRFFPRPIPEDQNQRREYAEWLLKDFASRAFRRPVLQDSLERLVQLAESITIEQGDTFEAGIAKAMTAVLASPQFLFREEFPEAGSDELYPLIDEFSLASRLSYFLWSTAPDEELLRLSTAGQLRHHLNAQIARMLRDERAKALATNFVGQWLRTRAIETIPIQSSAVLERESREPDPESDVRRKRFFELFRKGDARTLEEQTEYLEAREVYRQTFQRGLLFELSDEVRRAMLVETEMVFQYILDEDRSLLELIDSDYTFLNDLLWGHYQIDGIAPVIGSQFRKVKLPTDSVRGGVLTQGTTLVVTSNPDRTSPVKRGLFILENLLGIPTSAPPPNIPALEDVNAHGKQDISLRETLAIHRANALCSSCHNRMDPLGLALENFNALGAYRTSELGQPIDASGVLATGEQFQDIRELKKILVTNRRLDFYRCVVEKMMTYAVGRSVEYLDSHTVDEIASQLEVNNGKISTLIYGIIHSPAFQRMTRP